MKRALTPRDIAAKKWKTLPWNERWSKPFGFPAENASWFISGASASGKSSFVMQLAKELCKYGPVLYMSYEERVNQSFQRRMGYLKMNEVQGRFRVVPESTLDELVERLKKPKSPKFVIIDSFQVAPLAFIDTQIVDIQSLYVRENMTIPMLLKNTKRISQDSIFIICRYQNRGIAIGHNFS